MNNQEMLKLCNDASAWKKACYDASRKMRRQLMYSVPADFQIIKEELQKNIAIPMTA